MRIDVQKIRKAIKAIEQQRRDHRRARPPQPLYQSDVTKRPEGYEDAMKLWRAWNASDGYYEVDLVDQVNTLYCIRAHAAGKLHWKRRREFGSPFSDKSFAPNGTRVRDWTMADQEKRIYGQWEEYRLPELPATPQEAPSTAQEAAGATTT